MTLIDQYHAMQALLNTTTTTSTSSSTCTTTTTTYISTNSIGVFVSPPRILYPTVLQDDAGQTDLSQRYGVRGKL